MRTPNRTRLINPRLGTYFGIFASAFMALFLALLIFEQLEAPDNHLKTAVLLGPLVLFAGIGAASFTVDAREFFAAGRRVPAVYNGLVFAVGAIGGTGLIAVTGLFFIDGFDAWFLVIGMFAGFLIMGIVIAPYLRKYGAYTVPSYLARRFESRLIRVVAASLFAVPLLLMLAAELSMAVHAAALLTGHSRDALALLLAVALSANIILGGMRAVGWVGAAQSIAAIIAIVLLAGIIGVILTNLPLAQLSHGPVLRHIGRLEEAQQIALPSRALFEFALAGQDLTSLAHRMAAPFGSIGAGSFTTGALVVMMGIAGAPWLLPRCATTIGVYEARKSLGWAIFFAGVVLLTLSAIAVFFRGIVMSELVGQSVDQLPGWFTKLRDAGLASVDGSGGRLALSSFSFARDGVLYAVPQALGFPNVVVYLVLAGAIAAALMAAAATAFTLATVIGEDIVGGLQWEPAGDVTRTHVVRIMCVVVVALGLIFHWLIRVDPLELFLSAIALSAATSFPVVVLSIWWKRLSVAGALASMGTGFGVLVVLMVANAGGVSPINLPVAGVIAVISAMTAAISVSLMTPVPQRSALEAAREMRIPGGETVYDRELRQARFSQRGKG